MKMIAKKLWNDKSMRVIRITWFSLLICYIVKLLIDAETIYVSGPYSIVIAKASLAVAVLIFSCKRINPFNWQTGIAAIVIFIGYLLYVSRLEEMFTMQAVAKYNAFTQWLVVAIVIDIILHKNCVGWNQYRLIAFLLYLLSAGFILYNRMGRDEMLFFALPAALFFTIRFTRAEWIEFAYTLFWGWFMAFVWVIIESIQVNPVIGEGRWYGYFPTLATFGFFLSGTIVMALWGILLCYKSNKKYVFGFAILWIMSISVVWFYVGTRTTLFALLGIVLVVIISKVRWTKRSYIIVAGVLVMVGLLSIALFSYITSFTEEELRAYVEKYLEMHGDGTIGYFLRRLLTPFYDVALQGDGFGARLTAMLDVFSGKRVSIVKAALEKVSFVPNGLVAIQVGGYIPGHAHNTYIQMAYQFGIPTAFFYISFFVYGLINRVRAYKKNHEAYNLLPVLWMAMMLTTWITETVVVCSAMTFMGLIALYPFVVKLDEEEKSEPEKTAKAE